MYAKKHIFVSIITIITMIILTGMLCISVYCLIPYISNNITTMLVSFLSVVVMLALIGLFTWLAAKRNVRKHKTLKPNHQIKVSECILLILLTGINFVIRLLPTVIFRIDDNTFFNLSVMMQRSLQIKEQVSYQVGLLTEPLAYGYSRFLSLAFALLGTKQPILLAANLALLFLMFLLLYILMRKVSGRVPALLAMITCYLIPSLLFSAFEVSQQILFTVLILAALLICMKFSSLSKEIELREQRPGGYIRSVFLGLILGFASVTDVSGILIALIIFALILSYKKGNISYVLVSFLFMCATGFLYIYDYINITKVNINDFIHSYLNEWIPNQISFPLFDHITRDNMRELNFFDGMKFSNGFMDTIIKLDDQFMIFLLLSVVIGCIFYFKKRTRAMFPVYLCTIAVCIFGVCKIGNGNYQILLSCMVIVLFSQYLRNSYDFFVFNETLGEAPDDETEMIENPLPMPAKHVAKCLDYDQQIEENVEFDIELDQETDDWDV